MTEVAGKTVLVVEDDFFIAAQMCRWLEDASAMVLGPAGRVEDALALIARSETIDGAVVDLNLHGTMVFPVARMLRERNVPFVFTTGYDDEAVPEAFRDVPRYQKPVEPERAFETLFG